MITRNSDDGNRLLSELMSCGVIIYDITQEPVQIEEACWVLKGPLIQMYIHAILSRTACRKRILPLKNDPSQIITARLAAEKVIEF